MARRVRLVRRQNQGSEGELPYNEWIPAHAVKFNTDGTTSLMTEKPEHNRGRRRRRNIAAGFYDEDGIFHPIRASYDYSPGRVGERAKRKKPKAKKRAKAKARKPKARSRRR